MMDAVEQLRQKLWDSYLNADGDCRQLINLLAVNWGSLNKTEIRNALRKTLGTAQAAKFEPGQWVSSGLLMEETGWNRSERYACHPLLMEPVARALVAGGSFGHYVDLARIASPLGSHYVRNNQDIRFENDDQLVREVRIGLYQNDEAYIVRLFEVLRRNQHTYWDGLPRRWPGPEGIYARVCGDPFDAKWFRGLPAGIQRASLGPVISSQLSEWRLNRDAYSMLQSFCKDAQDCNRDYHLYVLAYAALLRGDKAVVERSLAGCRTESEEMALEGLYFLLRMDLDRGLHRLEESLRLLRKSTGRRKAFHGGIIGVLHVLALTLRNRGRDLEEARKLVEMVNDEHFSAPLFHLLRMGLGLEADEKGVLSAYRSQLIRLFSSPAIGPWEAWLGLFILLRYDSRPDPQCYLPVALRYQGLAQANGLDWLAAEMGQLIFQLDATREDFKTFASEFRSRSGYTLLVDRVQHEAPWERALTAISNAVEKTATLKDTTATADEYRLAWILSEAQGYGLGYSLEAREQKRNANGEWGKGKTLSFKKIQEMAKECPYFSDQDRRIASHVVMDPRTRGYELAERGWLGLVGHSAVFLDGRGTTLEVVLAEPELRVKKKDKQNMLRIEFWPTAKHNQSLVVKSDGLNRIKLIQLRPEHRRLAEIIGAGIEAPTSAEERVIASLGAVASLVTIHSDIGGAGLSEAETVTADPQPRIQLTPEGEGLRLAILIRPFGDRGSYYAPGSGGAGLIAVVDGKRLQTQRDLKYERTLADRIVEACPILDEKAESLANSQWVLEDAEASLELLLQLQALGNQAQIEWPQGEKFRMLGQAGLSQFSVKLQQQRDWFNLQGELKLDQGEVVGMQRLLELLDESRGRFVRLDENRFLALTDAFRKRLEDLRAYSEKHGKEQRINPLALPVMEEIAEEVGEFKADAAWRKHLERLRQAEQFKPSLPSTLQAELRDYQMQGFDWLSRLSAWGVGACLADDMGLGKTLQAIALILARAGGGPSLVVAPTSVCFNWQNEVARFAPTLNLKALGAGDRQLLVEQLQPLDLLVCSYGLLQQEAVGELLGSVRWQTIVLDEAQAIKNPATKRSQQAMGLQGEFKLVTTGTPIENHLGELWALFRFINPGLLGSLESFNRRFAGPIERSQDREIRQRLKRLIQPFILRRTKSQVLDELPPRTEIELQVELSEKEASFYEALRRKLLEELNNNQGPVEDKRFQVLAAITKLRRACCNPKLIAPELGLPSSKLALFAETLEELLENRHKALVFSQFVDHLSILREYLDGKGIAYQYLDGQTPANERKKRVEAFQNGQGEVFLISLKAGGVGLNLTAADYVIHMDPWWNPAVEDQASDRAHRIGQQRPVTVYRLVTRGTIEEQIVSLHRHKRDLADSLLEGGEISAKVGAEDLLRLMRGE